MSAELGHFALILAFCLALPQAFFGLVGAATRRPHWMALTTRAVAGQFVFTAFAFACLAYCFYRNDFSVLYVAQNSNSELPTFYRFAAVWGAHEGSLLLWLLVQAIWTVAVAFFSRNMPDTMTSRVLGVLGLISAGFAHRVGKSKAAEPVVSDSRVDEHRNLGVAFYKTGMLDEAMREFRRVAELRESDAPARFYIGLALMRQGKWADAVTAFTDCVAQPGVGWRVGQAMGARIDFVELLDSSIEQLGEFDARVAKLGGQVMAAARGEEVGGAREFGEGGRGAHDVTWCSAACAL
jgi:hypothetical protein